MHWWIVTHVPFEGSAPIATMMDAKGIRHETCAPYAGSRCRPRRTARAWS